MIVDYERPDEGPPRKRRRRPVQLAIGITLWAIMIGAFVWLVLQWPSER